MLVILVGESGVGKSTFAKAVDCPENLYLSSGLIIEMLKERGVEVTHNSIHALAKEVYGENPYWQIPHILAKLGRKGFLVLDGSRQIFEIRRLIELHPKTLVIRITADSLSRYNRLEGRDRISFEDFRRIEEDEAKETGLKETLEEMVDITIENNGSLEKFQKIAWKFSIFLKGDQE